MRIQFTLVSLLYLLNISSGYSQETGLSLKITRVYKGMEWCKGTTPSTNNVVGKTMVQRYKPPITDKDLVLRAELTNVSNETILMDHFSYLNGFEVELPDGKVQNVGFRFACYEGVLPITTIAPQQILCKSMEYRFSDKRIESGIYKFYYVFNEIRSEAFIYKHVREE